MRAFLLAAGLGTRLRPLTDSVPKCLVPIGGVPILGVWLEICERAGIEAALVNLHHLPEQVLEFLEHRETAVRVVTTYEETLLGSAGTVLANRDFVEGESEFFVIYVDNWTDADLRDMAVVHRARGTDLTMGLFLADNPSGSGIAVLGEDDRILAFEEKPARPRSNLANAGIYVMSPTVLDRLPSRRPLDFGLDVLPRLVGEMHGYRLKGFLRDLGTREAYAVAQAEWAAGRRLGGQAS